MKRLALLAFFVIGTAVAENEKVFFTESDFSSPTAVFAANGALYTTWLSVEVAKYMLWIDVIAKTHQKVGFFPALIAAYLVERGLKSDVVAVLVAKTAYLIAYGIGSVVNAGEHTGPALATEEHL